jgi:hypothetical protein
MRDEARIRAVLAVYGVTVESVRTRQPSLEDVFVSRVRALEQAVPEGRSA